MYKLNLRINIIISNIFLKVLNYIVWSEAMIEWNWWSRRMYQIPPFHSTQYIAGYLQFKRNKFKYFLAKIFNISGLSLHCNLWDRVTSQLAVYRILLSPSSIPCQFLWQIYILFKIPFIDYQKKFENYNVNLQIQK